MERRSLYFVLGLFFVSFVVLGILFYSDLPITFQPKVVSQCSPTGLGGEESCFDGLDNDCDGNTDCDDSDCTIHLECKVPELENIVPNIIHPSTLTPVYLKGDNFMVGSRVLIENSLIPKEYTHYISKQMLVVLVIPGAPSGDYEIFVTNNLDRDFKSRPNDITFVNSVDYSISSCDVCSNLEGLGCNRFSCEMSSSSCFFETTINSANLNGVCSSCNVGSDSGCEGYGSDALSCVQDGCGFGSCSFIDGMCESFASPSFSVLSCSGLPPPTCIPWGVCANTIPSCSGGNWICSYAQNTQSLEAYVELSCGDGLDNDCDDKVDCSDTDCSNNPVCNSQAPGGSGGSGGSGIPEPECDDDLDNDGDGLIDLSDPGCSSSIDNDEMDTPSFPTYVPTVAACNDGLDNDGDGLIDLNDPGCDSSSDFSEVDFVPTGGSGIQTLNEEESKIGLWIALVILGVFIVIITIMIVLTLRKGRNVRETNDKLTIKKPRFPGARQPVQSKF